MQRNTTSSIQIPAKTPKDVLTEILRDGAREMLGNAIEAQVSDYVAAHAHQRGADAHRLVVRNGHAPRRELQTGLGAITVKQPRVNDKRVDDDGNRFRFTSNILPPYLRKTKSIEEMISWLYLRGISTGDFSQTLAALLGPEAPGLSASTVVRLKQVWQQDHETWSKRSLTDKQYVYGWVDGIYFNIRLEEDRRCILVVMGATESGKKKLITIQDAFRENEQSWTELLLDLKARGLEAGPQPAVGDGALGFWKALRQVYSESREQRGAGAMGVIDRFSSPVDHPGCYMGSGFRDRGARQRRGRIETHKTQPNGEPTSNIDRHHARRRERRWPLPVSPPFQLGYAMTRSQKCEGDDFGIVLAESQGLRSAEFTACRGVD